jgi:hypothetical protein
MLKSAVDGWLAVRTIRRNCRLTSAAPHYGAVQLKPLGGATQQIAALQLFTIASNCHLAAGFPPRHYTREIPKPTQVDITRPGFIPCLFPA